MVCITTISFFQIRHSIPNERLWSGIRIAVCVQSFLNELDIVPLPPLFLLQSCTPLRCLHRPQLWLDLSQCFKKSIHPETIHHHQFLSFLDALWGSEVVYKDGSLIAGHVDYACAQVENTKLNTLLDSCSVFSTELVAIFSALDHIYTCIWEFFICSDFLSGLLAVDQCYPHHPLVLAIQEAIYTLEHLKTFCSLN